jgi:hypothetical protein
VPEGGSRVSKLACRAWGSKNGGVVIMNVVGVGCGGGFGVVSVNEVVG